MKAVAYTRVSTEEQADSRLGLEAQRRDIERAALAQGITIIDWKSDPGIGAEKLENRPGLLSAIAMMSEDCALIFQKWDRVSRHKNLSGWLEKEAIVRGSMLISAAGEGTSSTDDPEDPMQFAIRTMIQMFAHWERLMIRARTRSALNAKRERGEALGNTPFGFRRNGPHLVRDDDEQATLARMRELAAIHPGKFSLIGRLLTAEGRGPRQPGWTRRSVGWLATGRLDTRANMALASAARNALADWRSEDGKARDYREIARSLNRAHIPPPPARWSAGQVRALLAGGRSVILSKR